MEEEWLSCFLINMHPGVGRASHPPALQRFSASTVDVRGAALIDKYVFVGYNTVIVQISNRGQIQNTLFGVDV